MLSKTQILRESNAALERINAELFTQLRINYEAIQALIETNWELGLQFEQLLDEVRALKSATPEVVAWTAQAPMHVPEHEEELKWALDNKLIDSTQFEEMLKEAEFQNTEVNFA